MDYLSWVPNRIAELRTQKGVSARDVSLSLGQSESYINKIENKRTMPSMAGFFYICEYFGITPQEFFNSESTAPQKVQELAAELDKLTAPQIEHLLLIIKDILGENKRYRPHIEARYLSYYALEYWIYLSLLIPLFRERLLFIYYYLYLLSISILNREYFCSSNVQ